MTAAYERCSAQLQQAKQQVESQCSFKDLPAHVAAQVFAHAGAPLLTCRASAAIAQDPSLVAEWLIRTRKHPLARAARHKLWEVCKLLLAHPHPLGMGDIHIDKKTDLVRALEAAAAGGSVEVVRQLLPRVQQCLHQHSFLSEYEVALERACANGHAPVYQVLIAQPYLTGSHVQLGLAHAAKHGRLGVLQQLRDRCLGPNAAAPEPPKGYCVLDQCLRPRSSSSQDLQYSWYFLVEEGLVAAAKAGQLEALTWFLGQGAAPNQAGRAVVDAGMAGQVPAVRLLWGWHEEVREWGNKALEMAIGWDQLESVQFLLKEGCEPYDVCLWNDAAGGSNADILAAVLEAWSAHVKPEDLSRALTRAIMRNSAESAKLLIKAGAQLNLDEKNHLCEATHPELLDLVRQVGVLEDSAAGGPVPASS